MAPYLPFTADLHVDGRVLAFAVVAAMLVTILAGLLPARLTGALYESARGITETNSLPRRMIVVGEVAVSVELLAGAALLFKSLANLQRLDAGVRIERVITMSTALPLAAYPKPEQASAFYHNLIERLQAVPGIERASISPDLPMQGVRGGELFYIPGRDDNVVVRFKRVDPNYFSVLGIPVVGGRPITARDRANTTKVVVINQVLARLLSSKYGLADPIGRTFRMTSPGYGKQDGVGADLLEIGIIRNESTGDLQAPLDPVVYVPLDQYPREDFRILVRTAQEPTAVVSGIRDTVRQLDPTLGLAEIRTLEEVKQRNLTWARQPAWLIGAFALVAAFLAALGLYGVLSHAVVQQRREIGIRMALGATAGKVLSRVLRNALTLVVIGLAIGLCGAMAMTRVMKALLFHVSPLDPAALAAAMASMIAVGLLASFLPANRAARVDPMTTLRED